MTSQGGKDWTILDGDVEIPEGLYVDPGDHYDFCTDCGDHFAYTVLGHAYCRCGVWFPSNAVDDLIDDDGDPVDGTGPGRFDGIPGLVWFAEVRKVLGAELKLGDWLDSLDHHGARSIWGIWRGAATRQQLGSLSFYLPDKDDPAITVMFGGGDTETIRADVEYDVVDPDSQVAPDGSPL
jgi:hypothetical protein